MSKLNLDDFERNGGLRNFKGSHEEYLGLAQEAARRFIGENILDVDSIYLANRFGELILSAYIPDRTYDVHELALPSVPNEYFGFKVVIQPKRTEIPNLKQYLNEYYFVSESNS